MCSVPCVLFCDWDNTIVGDISYIVEDFKLSKHIAGMSDAPSIDSFFCNRIAKVASSQFTNSGLTRPFFVQTIRALKERYSNLFVYVYSLSDDTWLDFIVSIFEQAHGITFERPLFGRSYGTVVDGTYRKSLLKVAEHVLTKHPGLTLEQLMEDYCAIVDDTMQIVHDLPQKQIMIPSYQFVHPYDILDKYDETIKNNSLVVAYIQNSDSKYICPAIRPLESAMDYDFRRHQFWMQAIWNAKKENGPYLKDNAWLNIYNTIIRFNPSSTISFSEDLLNALHQILYLENKQVFYSIPEDDEMVME